jgi:hypothetical protein
MHDLGNCINRLRLFKKIKQLFNSEIINYTTLDMYHIQPSGSGFIFKNYLLGKKIGAKIIYNGHINSYFQSYINSSNTKYYLI